MIATISCLPFIVPFLFLVSTAIREPADYMADPGGLPKSFTIANVVGAWVEADLGRALLNTLLTCVVACLVCAAVALAGAFWFRLNHARSSDVLRWVLVSGYAIPVVAWLIPVFVMLAKVGLTSNLLIVGLINGASALPFGLYLVHTYFTQVLTAEVLEAARLDGAGVFKTLPTVPSCSRVYYRAGFCVDVRRLDRGCHPSSERPECVHHHSGGHVVDNARRY